MRILLLCCLLCGAACTQVPKVYRIDSNASASVPLYEFDFATMSWSTLANVPTACTTTIASDGTDVYCLPEDGQIYRYDPVGDTWVFVQIGPAAAVGRRNISFFETMNGEFYWGNDSTSTFHYTVGGVWTSTTTPASVSSGSDVDVQNGLVYVRTYGELGFFAFDPATQTFPIVCADPTGVGENSRVGVFVEGAFYTREWDQPLQRFDVSSCVRTGTGAALSSYHSSTCTDGSVIYLNGYGMTQTTFEAYDIMSGTVTSLPAAPMYPGNTHPSMAFVGQSSRLVALREVMASVSPVPPGGTGLPISFTAENVGMALIDVVRTELSFTDSGGVDVNSEYIVTPDPANPTRIVAGATETFDFTIDIAPTATLGTITVDGLIEVLDPVAMTSGVDARADVTAVIDVVGAAVEIRTVDAQPVQVTQGGAGYQVSVDIENTGLTPFASTGALLTFVGTADRTSEYTISPDPTNPTQVAAVSTASFLYSVAVDAAATIETITIDARIAGFDAVTGLLLSDVGADTPDAWDVVACGATLCGDCNGDLTITILDALVGAQHAAGLITLTGVSFTNCNVIGLVEPAPAAMVDIIDALTLAQFAAGLPVTLACC